MNKIRSFCLRSGFMFALIIAFSFTLFTFPVVSAAESNTLLIDLFKTANGINATSGNVSASMGSWEYYISANSTGTISIPLPELSFVGYVDIVIYLGSGWSPSCSFSYSGTSLSTSVCGPYNNFVRVYGKTNKFVRVNDLVLTITNPSAYDLWHSVVSAKFSSSDFFYDDLKAPFSLTCGSTTLSGKLPDHKSFTFTTGYDYWNSYISIPNFQSYDYIYVSFFTSLNTITSISCASNQGYIPIETSFIETDGLVDAPYNYVTVMIDLSNIDRSSLGTLDLYISGGCVTGQSHSFTVYEVQGGLISSFDPLNWHLTNIFSALGTLAGEMDDPAREQEGAAMKDKGKDTANRVDDAVSGMDAMNKPEVGSGDLTGDVSDIISVDTIEGSTVILSNFFQMPVVSEVVVIALTIALAGYVLFGKRR